MDALLDIIEKNKVLILDVDLCAITEQYNQYVQDLLAKSALSRLKIDRISDYLILAQYLIRIKTLYLLQKQKEFFDERNTQFN
ncbi:segregation/condensation protein A [bacterium]|nr:segregation/condensation protein A [bacterium]MBP5783159.1 segregation/condensation protein A [bacterium]